MEIIDQILREHLEIKLELGAGSKPGTNGWITLDQNEVCDINWDLANGIPFPDGSVSVVYASHLLEHFYFRDLMSLLFECYRVLKTEGVISICVPCARLFIEAYTKKDRTFWERIPRHFMPAWNDTSTMMDILNYMAYMDGHHKFMFDEENLVRILELAGFRDSRLREFDPDVDNPDRRPVSIFAMAKK
jgi:predicted SAM-dependent methyltransferase